MCNFRLKNPKKMSPNQTKIQMWAWHPRGHVNTLGVLTGLNAQPSPRTS